MLLNPLQYYSSAPDVSWHEVERPHPQKPLPLSARVPFLLVRQTPSRPKDGCDRTLAFSELLFRRSGVNFQRTTLLPDSISSVEEGAVPLVGSGLGEASAFNGVKFILLN